MSIALRLALAAAVLSGAAALVYEVVWLRMLGLVVGDAGTALSAVLAAFIAALMPASLSLREALHLSYGGFGLVQVGLACALLLLPTVLMGGTLPLLSQGLSNDDPTPARVAGGLYTANTAGAVMGALAAGYWLLPVLGNRATGWVAGCANFAAAALLVTAAPRPDPAVVLPPNRSRVGSEGAGAGAWLIPAAVAVSGVGTMGLA